MCAEKGFHNENKSVGTIHIKWKKESSDIKYKRGISDHIRGWECWENENAACAAEGEDHMKIGGMNSVSAPVMGAGQQTDALSRSLQKQIEDVKKQLQEISSDKNMSDEEKMKKRQELQKKMTDLNQQLKQHQMEQKREAREKTKKEKESSMEDMLGGRSSQGAKGGTKSAVLSTGSMQSIISADCSMKQAKVQGRAAAEMKGRENVLEVEIKLDGARAGSSKGVDAKKEQLAETRERRMGVESAQMQTLVKANNEAGKAAEDMENTEQTKDGQKKAQKTETKQTKTGEKTKDGSVGKEETKSLQNEEEAGMALSERQEEESERRYTHMDVRL